LFQLSKISEQGGGRPKQERAHLEKKRKGTFFEQKRKKKSSLPEPVAAGTKKGTQGKKGEKYALCTRNKKKADSAIGKTRLTRGYKKKKKEKDFA